MFIRKTDTKQYKYCEALVSFLLRFTRVKSKNYAFFIINLIPISTHHPSPTMIASNRKRSMARFEDTARSAVAAAVRRGTAEYRSQQSALAAYTPDESRRHCPSEMEAGGNGLRPMDDAGTTPLSSNVFLDCLTAPALPTTLEERHEMKPIRLAPRHAWEMPTTDFHTIERSSMEDSGNPFRFLSTNFDTRRQSQWSCLFSSSADDMNNENICYLPSPSSSDKLFLPKLVGTEKSSISIPMKTRGTLIASP